ncbi:MAG: hypothetical protein HOV83_06985 [Catenulispora sp.]|nr:hypothetical protein [Catenulispora sp.]
MASRAVIIGAADYAHQRLNSPELHDAVGASAEKYLELLSSRDPFRAPDACVLLANPVSRDQVMNAVLAAAEDAHEPDDVLLVVYIGHGKAWPHLYSDELHFAVGSSDPEQPWTWLEWRLLAWAMRRDQRGPDAGLRVLVADCCYTSKLTMGDTEESVPTGLPLIGADKGLAVFSPSRSTSTEVRTFPRGCRSLGEPWSRYTAFSGHFLKVLHDGSDRSGEHMLLGEVRDALHKSMKDCRDPDSHHDVPGLEMQGPNDRTPFIENAVPMKDRVWKSPVTFEDHVADLEAGRSLQVDRVLTDPALAARLRNWLSERPRDEIALANAARLDAAINEQASAECYARYRRLRRVGAHA